MKPTVGSLNAVTLGISRDDLESHRRFIDKFGLTMPLLSDLDGKVCGAYDVWRLKERDGKTFFGIERSTFVVNAQGQLALILRKVDPEKHISEVIQFLKQIGR